MRICGMRPGVTVDLSPSDRERLQAIVDDRNTIQKHVWRARIVLGTADGLGTVEIMQTARVSKTVVWRWQARFMEEGVEGLLRDKTCPPGIARLPREVAERVAKLTLTPPPGETTHWTGRMMAKAAAVSLTSEQRIWRAHGLAAQASYASGEYRSERCRLEELLRRPEHGLALGLPVPG